jgi:hypothetical protein
MIFPVSGDVRASFVVAGLFRGVWSGLAGGLVLRRSPLVHLAVAMGVGASIGAAALYFGLKVIAAWEVPVAVALAVGVAVGTHLLAQRFGERIAVALALALVLTGLVWQIGVLPGPFQANQNKFLAEISREPVAEQYGFDGQIFLRTMFLTKAGMPYYEAFTKAIVEDRRFTVAPPLTFNYREPWPARFVALLPGNAGIDAWLVFAALAVAAIVGGFVLARRFVPPGVALLGSMFLATYYAYPLTTKWFPLIELWSGAVAVWVVIALLKGRWWAAAGLVTVAVAMRELMVYLIPVGWSAWAFRPDRRKLLLPVLAMTVLPVAVLVYHVAFAPGSLRAQGGSVGMWMHGGLVNLVAAMRFCGKRVAWGNYTMPDVAVLAFLGAALVPFAWRKALLVSAVSIPLLALAVLGNGVYGYYWGGVAQPLLIAIAPLAFLALIPAEPSSGDHQTDDPATQGCES